MRPRHKKKGTQPQIHTDADRRLSARATSSYLPYSTLKLALTRFSWGGEGVEIRAHQKILAWANTIVDGCVDEANSLGIPAERFLRNLLPMLSEWTASLLIACLQHNPALRRKVSGLKLDLLLLNSGDNRLDLFKKLLASEPKACIPSDLVTFIRLSNYALDQAWIRWLKGHNDHNNIGRLLASSSNWDDRYGRITKILLTAGLPEERVSLLCVPELQKATVTEPTEVNSIPRLVWLVREGGSAPGIQRKAHRRQEQTPFQASWPLVLENLRADKPDPAILRAFVETATANPKNARWANKQLQAVSQTCILAEWPLEGDNTWQPPPSTFTYVQRISLLYAGKLATVNYLNSLSASRLKSVISSLGTDNLVLMATSLWALEPEAQPDQIKANVAREILNIVIPVASAEQIPSLLVNRAHMKGRVRHTILERLRSFTPDEFALFITGSSILEDQWKHLPIALREEILDLWIRFEPKLKNDQTVSSGILVDAARWGNDHAALVHVLYGAQPLQAIPVLRLWLADKEQNVWRNFLKLLYRAGPFPEATMLAIATDKRLLDALLRDAISCFSGTALKHIDLAVLFPYALKHRWLSYEIEACFSAEELARVHEPLKNTLKNYPRRWAAVELALAMGPRYSTSLYYLSTRRFAEKPGARFDRLYHSWSLPKRKGGTRLITAPKPFLKALQRSLLRTFFSDLPLHPAATGFRTGLSIADNARPHVGQPVVVNVDITGFFQNTHFPLVARAIENALPKYMSPETRRLVTDICCYDGVLPTGAPTSPAIANLVLRRADHSISKVAGRNQITYTRYADDLTFSGEEPLKILPFVRDVLDGLGYKLDKKKTNIFRKGRRQIVTGLVVNQKVSVPRLMRRKLRAAVHRATQKSVDLTWHKAPMTMAELEGRIAFTAIAHREEALGMLKALRDKKEAKSES